MTNRLLIETEATLDSGCYRGSSPLVAMIEVGCPCHTFPPCDVNRFLSRYAESLGVIFSVC